jgi:acylphosphatase
MLTRRLIVGGRVQGVGYRLWFARAAQGMGLRGWVRNRRDGTVEAVLRGPENLIADMIAAAKDGPPLARVVSVEAAPAEDAHAAETDGGHEEDTAFSFRIREDF